MPLNPCGRLVDFGRRPYDVTSRPFSDSDLTATQHWFVTSAGAPSLGFPTSFMSLDWVTQPWQKEPPGEVYGATRRYNGDWGMGGRFGPGPCGTPDEFLNGVPYDPAADVQYDTNLLPVCCGGPVGVGGISWSGMSIVRTVTHWRTYYGVSWSGTAIVNVGPAPVTSSGGISWSGTALVNVHPAPVTSSGGISWSGTADVAQVLVETTDGGISWSGTADVAQVLVETTDGGISWSGTADVDVIPAEDGLTCAGAFVVSDGVPFPFSIPTGETRWFRIDATTGTTLTVSLSSVIGPATGDVFDGDCSSLNFIGAVTIATPAVCPGLTTPAPFWCAIDNFTGGSTGDITFAMS